MKENDIFSQDLKRLQDVLVNQSDSSPYHALHYPFQYVGLTISLNGKSGYELYLSDQEKEQLICKLRELIIEKKNKYDANLKRMKFTA